MSASQVLYRKWRPHCFADLAGQKQIADTLRRAVATGRVAHAYLFTGPRGVGKTSTARILAKALNCTALVDGEPDNTCRNCADINSGRFFDFVEIDAASNRSIDNVRELIENVRFSPVNSSWKIYVIDEAHMLTTPAFNALLKTLEEPPPHVVFALATTESHNLPTTIISRCQRYDFKRIANEDVLNCLSSICAQEGFQCEEGVLQLIAQAAWGSLRDAENMLERLVITSTVASTEQNDKDPGSSTMITQQSTLELLGMTDTVSSVKLAAAILAENTKEALLLINEHAEQGTNLNALRNGVIEQIRTAMFSNLGLKTRQLTGISEQDTIAEFAAKVSLEQILHVLTCLGESHLKRSSAISSLDLEIAVMRALTFVEAKHPPATTLNPHTARSTPRQRTGSATPSTPMAASPSWNAIQHAPPKVQSNSPWGQTLQALRATPEGEAMRRLLTNVTPPTITDGLLKLVFKQGRLREQFKKRMENAKLRTLFKQAAEIAFQQPLELQLSIVSSRIQNPVQPSARDPAANTSPSTPLTQPHAVDETTTRTQANNSALESPILATLKGMGAVHVKES